MTSSSSAATTRRRKIFPHLEDEKRSASDAAADGDGDGGGRGRGATNDDVGDVATRKGNEKDDKHSSTYNNAKSKKGKKSANKPSSIPKTEGGSSSSVSITHQHLLPLPLVLTVLVCSGIFWIASFRDVMATGKPILDTLSMIWGQEDADANYLVSLYT